VVHLLKVLEEEKEDLPLKRPLTGLKVACYYGCLLVRPRDILDFDDEENPQIMDHLIEALGAQSIDWGFKTECCGASLPLTRKDIVLTLSHRILYQAKQLGADCLAVACPMCHSNLDTTQREIEAKYKDGVGLPILYFTQLVGLAMGFSPKQLLLNKHLTDPLPMLKEKELA
jgi:heterodisulfide reductase subunit B